MTYLSFDGHGFNIIGLDFTPRVLNFAQANFDTGIIPPEYRQKIIERLEGLPLDRREGIEEAKALLRRVLDCIYDGLDNEGYGPGKELIPDIEKFLS